MADQEREQAEIPYIKEKIKRRKANPLRFLLRVLFCVLLAVIFGAVAGFVFVVVRPWAEQIGMPEESSTPVMVELPTFVQDNSSEYAPTRESQEETTTINEEEVAFNDAQRQWIRSLISSMIDRDSPDISDVDEVDRLLNRAYMQAQKSLAEVSGYSAAGERLWQVMGVLFYKNEETDEVLILTDASSLTDTGDIRVEIPTLPETSISASVKGWDHVFNLAVLSVSTTALSKEDIAKISLMEIGNSYQVKACDTVLLVGAPYLMHGSVAIGNITYVDIGRMTVDSTYRLFDTDISLPEGAAGFMINTSGELVGILTGTLCDKELSHYGVAVGTEELKGTLNSMINGMPSSLLGVYAADVTEKLMEQGMPSGVYVSDVLVDGPAYQAGISAGDVITGISMSGIASVSELTQCMTEEHLPEETVIVKIMRMGPEGYKPMEISVTLGAR